MKRGAALVLLSLGLLLLWPSVGAAQPCGADGQRPCKVWERIPSCNRGLVEDFAKGRCVTPRPKSRPQPAAKPPSCGREGQRPCLVTERIPSCDRGLVEDIARGRCIALAAPGSTNRGW